MRDDYKILDRSSDFTYGQQPLPTLFDGQDQWQTGPRTYNLRVVAHSALPQCCRKLTLDPLLSARQGTSLE